MKGLIKINKEQLITKFKLADDKLTEFFNILDSVLEESLHSDVLSDKDFTKMNSILESMSDLNEQLKAIKNNYL